MKLLPLYVVVTVSIGPIIMAYENDAKTSIKRMKSLRHQLQQQSNSTVSPSSSPSPFPSSSSPPSPFLSSSSPSVLSATTTNTTLALSGIPTVTPQTTGFPLTAQPTTTQPTDEPQTPPNNKPEVIVTVGGVPVDGKNPRGTFISFLIVLSIDLALFLVACALNTIFSSYCN